MSRPPETRASLLIRIRDPEDQEAWHDFVQIYRPVIYRMGRRQGLQDADAEDLSQQVLMKIGQAIERWEPDRRRGLFRTWLYKVAHNAILNALTRGPKDRPFQHDDPRWLFEQKPSREGPDSDVLKLEFRREVFHWAARQIRQEFKQGTWDAFWLTAVDSLTIEQAGEKLKKSPGAIYAARSRVMKRLNEKIQEFDAAVER